MTNDEIHGKLNEWLKALLSIPVIKDRQQADRPAAPYGMTDLANWDMIDDHVTDFVMTDGPDDTVVATPDYEIEWVFLFFIYGAQGENLVRRLQSAVHVLQLQEPLTPALIIHEVSRANSIPELVGQKWEPRTQVNIVVRGKSDVGFEIDTIETHDITVTGERA